MPPQPDLTFPPRHRDVAGRHPASTTDRVGVPASVHLSEVLTDLSASVSHLRGLQQLHVSDDELVSQLRRAAAELESLITHLLHSSASGSGSATTTRSSPATPFRRAAEQAFLAWLAEPTSADEVALAGVADAEPLARVLGELSLSKRVLPAEMAVGAGLPCGTTVGHVATELLRAVEDPSGPRCRSFRAAVFYLHDLDRGLFLEPWEVRR
jgi:hypothetical protein